ncbi:MAG: hypothetical protein KAT32_00665 [Candidatus Moranbacteria bacterium]|nr:hypothetical protein [Candidatus Moranbacteria bacterium]
MNTIVPQIDLDKEIDFTDKIFWLYLDYEEPPISLNLKHFNILLSLNEIHFQLKESYRIWKDLGMSFESKKDFSVILNKIEGNKRKNFPSIYSTFLIKRVIEEFISLYYYFSFYRKYKKFPKIIKIDSIGRLLNNKKNKNLIKELELQKIKEKNKKFLYKLNDISNAHKHSFINTEVNNVIGHDEPIIYALRLENNNLDLFSGQKNFYGIAVNEILKDFNKFIKDSYEFLKKFEEKN